MQNKITNLEYEKLVSYFKEYYEYDESGNELPINPLSYRDVLGDTCLHIACSRGDFWAVELLVRGGSDVNAIGDMEMTPLHAVHRAKNIKLSDRDKIENYLIKHGANLKVRDGFGLLPLQLIGENDEKHPTKSKWNCDKKKY